MGIIIHLMEISVWIVSWHKKDAKKSTIGMMMNGKTGSLMSSFTPLARVLCSNGHPQATVSRVVDPYATPIQLQPPLSSGFSLLKTGISSVDMVREPVSPGEGTGFRRSEPRGPT